MHFAVKYALEEQLRRKARLRHKRRISAVQHLPAEPPPLADPRYASSLRLLGGDARQFLRRAKARGYCTYDDLSAQVPADAVLSADEIEQLLDTLLSIGIEVREASPFAAEDTSPALS